MKLSIADKSSPTRNAFAEGFIRTVKEELVDYDDYRDFKDAFRQLKHSHSPCVPANRMPIYVFSNLGIDI